ncbi:MAG: adenosine deaminase [Opitutaceae bacterium]|nr:adenosine deaminase [Opitutaceae bacterium]
MRDFIQALPKTETHLHVEGALPYELLTDWDPEQWPPDPLFRSRSYRYATFPDFERILLDHALPWFTTAERYHQAAKVIFAKHVAQNVRYVETSFHLPIVTLTKLTGPEIIAAIRAAVPDGLEVRILAGMLRSDIAGELRPIIEQLHDWDGLAGVDLHGNEQLPTHPDTAALWARIRAAGKMTKCHAGEFDGPARVREAIEVLGVRRIQHGIRAIEDPAVVRLAVAHGATFDVCPLSNVGLKVVSALKEHPIRRLMTAGVRCTVSTDDPLCFANTLTEEYESLATELTFTRKELAQVARNGWEVADVGAEVRNRMTASIDRILAAAG